MWLMMFYPTLPYQLSEKDWLESKNYLGYLDYEYKHSHTVGLPARPYKAIHACAENLAARQKFNHVKHPKPNYKQVYAENHMCVDALLWFAKNWRKLPKEEAAIVLAFRAEYWFGVFVKTHGEKEENNTEYASGNVNDPQNYSPKKQKLPLALSSVQNDWVFTVGYKAVSEFHRKFIEAKFDIVLDGFVAKKSDAARKVDVKKRVIKSSVTKIMDQYLASGNEKVRTDSSTDDDSFKNKKNTPISSVKPYKLDRNTKKPKVASNSLLNKSKLIQFKLYKLIQ